DVVGGEAVLQAVGSTRVAGDVAADGGDGEAGRVGRVHETVLGGGGVQVARDHAGAGDRHQVGRVDLEVPEPLHAEHDAAPERDRSADQPAAGAAGRERGAGLGAELHH